MNDEVKAVGGRLSVVSCPSFARISHVVKDGLEQLTADY
jgi:hypothetical protein